MNKQDEKIKELEADFYSYQLMEAYIQVVYASTELQQVIIQKLRRCC